MHAQSCSKTSNPVDRNVPNEIVLTTPGSTKGTTTTARTTPPWYLYTPTPRKISSCIDGFEMDKIRNYCVGELKSV